MRAWLVDRPGPLASRPLVAVDAPLPAVGAADLLVEVSACAVCRTDLHLAEGDLAPRRPRVVPGHQAVGRVVDRGAAATGTPLGTRVGIAWLRHTCGRCRWCRADAENLCPHSRYTGWDADGGFAEYAVVPEAFAYRLPAAYSDERAAPLLCAGIIGYRALRRAKLPAGGRLGIYGFGASAHLAAQVAVAEGARVHVLTRSARARRLALELGAASAAEAADGPPERLDAAILFAPAGELVPIGLAALERGGTFVVAGVHLSDVPRLAYAATLSGERDLRSVTANTRADGEAFLELASRLQLRVTTTAYPLVAADRALADLAAGRVAGAAVLHR